MSTPGATPDQPLWTMESWSVSGTAKLVRALDLTCKIITTAYTLWGAWQVAKALNPALKVKEDLLMAGIRRRFERPAKDGLPGLTPSETREIYDDTR